MWSKIHISNAAANTAQPRRANLGKVLEAARAVLPRQHSVEERCDAFFIKHANEIDELLLRLADDDNSGERVQAELHSKITENQW